MRARVAHLARFLRVIVTHPRVPRWVRYGLVVLLAIPGPFDEAAAAIVLAVVAWRRWDVVCECWEQAKHPV